MKDVILAVDQMVERDNTTEILEHFLALFPDAKIVTLAHKKGAIAGRAERSPIYSTYLSHFVKSKNQLNNYLPLIPGALNGLKLPKDIKFIISISSGFIHGLEIEGVPHYSYVYGWNSFYQYGIPWHSKMFRKFVDRWREKNLYLKNLVSFSAKSLGHSYSHPQTKIIEPLFKLNSALFDRSKALFDGPKKILVLKNNHLTSKQEQVLKKFSDIEMITLAGNELNSDNITKIANEAWLTIDFTASEFPEYALHALATGCPVSVRDGELQREYLGDSLGVFYNHEVDMQSLSNLEIDRKQLRRNALRFNGRIFKSRTLRYLEAHNWPLN